MNPTKIKWIRFFKAELIKKSQESALAAVQIFNSPTIAFKSKTYTVLMITA